eukprot:scaffold116520_cov38-Prasinocladus_malaysianus.AAC.1
MDEYDHEYQYSRKYEYSQEYRVEHSPAFHCTRSSTRTIPLTLLAAWALLGPWGNSMSPVLVVATSTVRVVALKALKQMINSSSRDYSYPRSPIIHSCIETLFRDAPG